MTGLRQVCRLGVAAMLPLAWVGQPAARVLDVGPGGAFAAPSDAAAVVRDGDTVTIAPGIYYDCALWRASGLTIVGTGPGVVITDRACLGKAAFVIQGDRVTIGALSFARVRVMDGNGAGIRAEGRDLVVTDSRFINNQIGILAGGQGGSLRISGCDFDGNGVSWDGQATHAVVAGSLDLLRIEHSSFRGARGGDHIASRARRTELDDNRLADEGGAMSGPLVSVVGGVLSFAHNTVDLSPGAAERPGAVLVSGDASAITVNGNTLHEPYGSVPLVRNWTGLTATEDANRVPHDSAAVSDRGAFYHRLRSRMAALRSHMHDVMVLVRHLAGQLMRA